MPLKILQRKDVIVMKYIDLPKVFSNISEDINTHLKETISYYGVPYNYTVFFMMKCLFVALIPYYEKYGINCDDLFFSPCNSEDEIIETIEDLSCYSSNMLYKLENMGWGIEFEQFYSSSNNNVSIEEYRSTPLAPFYSYMDGLIDDIRNGFSTYHVHAIVFANERLGNFFNYAKTHEIETTLYNAIVNEVSYIEQFFDINCSVSTNVQDCYKIAYFKTDLPEMDFYFHGEMFSHLLLFHAKELELLLNEAFQNIQ